MSYSQSPGGRCAVYLRISEAEKGDFNAIDRQEQANRAFAAERGWDVTDVYTDHSRSAFKVSTVIRGDFQELQAAVSRGEYSRVVAWKVDRLARNLSEYITFVESAKRAGCQVWVAEERMQLTTLGDDGLVDNASSSTGLLGIFKAWVAEEESRVKSARLRATNQQKRERGQVLTLGPGSYGYRWNKDRTALELEPVEALVLQEAYRRVAAGESPWSVAKSFDDRDLLDCPRPGRYKAWKGGCLTGLLMKPRNAGYYGSSTEPDQTEFMKGDWPEVVSPDEWWHVRNLLLERHETRRNPGAFKARRLGSKLFRCGTCGADMWATTSDPANTVASYYCSARKRDHTSRFADGGDSVTDPAGRVHPRVNATRVDTLVEAATLATLARGGTQELLQDGEEAAERHELVSARAAANERLRQTARMFREGWMTEDQLKEITVELRQRIAQIDARLAPTRHSSALAEFAETDGDADTIRVVWDGLAVPQRRLVIDTLFTVTLHSRGKGRHFKPECVEMTPR